MSTSQPHLTCLTTQFSKMEAGKMKADEFRNYFLNSLISRFEHWKSSPIGTLHHATRNKTFKPDSRDYFWTSKF